MLFLLVFIVEHIGSLEAVVFRVLDISVGAGTFSDAGFLSIKDIKARGLVTHTGNVAETESFGNIESQPSIGLETTQLPIVYFMGGRGERILHRIAFFVGDIVFFILQQALVISIDPFGGAIL